MKLFEILKFLFSQWQGYRLGSLKRSKPHAEIVLDSISPQGSRLTTMLIVTHRFVLAELNTHRVFSRNSESSRAVPTRLRIARVLFDLAFPVEWGANQSGMQASALLSPFRERVARTVWRFASWCAVACTLVLYLVNLHKQLANRLLEPFLWHTTVVSSTEWENFFLQRSSRHTKLAQPELRATADLMLEALMRSIPTKLDYGEWHMPFTEYADGLKAMFTYLPKPQGRMAHSPAQQIHVSVARCAQSAYAKLGEADLEKDLKRYGNLVNAKPMHASPLEHVARPLRRGEQQIGNFRGWRQWRHQIQAGLED